MLSLLENLFKNQIEGTPILKLAMVKNSSKKFVEKNSSKKFVEKIRRKKFVEKKIVKKNRQNNEQKETKRNKIIQKEPRKLTKSFQITTTTQISVLK